MVEPLDDINWQILRALQENARLTFSELGRRVGLTAPAVAERVRRLEEVGVIAGYRVELDTARIGLPLTAFVRFIVRQGTAAKLVPLADRSPEVLEFHRITGGDSCIMKVAVASTEHLEELIDRFTVLAQPTTSLVLSSPVTHKVIDRPAVAPPDERWASTQRRRPRERSR